MFTPDPTWAGPLVAGAAVALRLYLKGISMDKSSEVDPRLQHVRDGIWELRTEYLDFLLLHDCAGRQWAEAMVWLVGWEVDTFVVATLHEDRGRLDA